MIYLINYKNELGELQAMVGWGQQETDESYFITPFVEYNEDLGHWKTETLLEIKRTSIVDMTQLVPVDGRRGRLLN